mmetsp:Transcript_48156/g.104297  ORF Transcript_48156/g.104297 Transcript_48156/m.104297 type:complete len:242 (-) Transcript_48156:190-915(-)
MRRRGRAHAPPWPRSCAAVAALLLPCRCLRGRLLLLLLLRTPGRRLLLLPSQLQNLRLSAQCRELVLSLLYLRLNQRLLSVLHLRDAARRRRAGLHDTSIGLAGHLGGCLRRWSRRRRCRHWRCRRRWRRRPLRRVLVERRQRVADRADRALRLGLELTRDRVRVRRLVHLFRHLTIQRVLKGTLRLPSKLLPFAKEIASFARESIKLFRSKQSPSNRADNDHLWCAKIEEASSSRTEHHR